MTGVPPSNTEPVLEVGDIDKKFPGVHALKRVSLTCRSGEIHGLIGENGAGKTTLMRILAGVLSPDSGKIHLNGRAVSLSSPRRAHDLGIAMVYQDTRLVEDLDVAQNVLLEREPGSFLHVNRRAMEVQVRSIFGRLGVDLDLRRLLRSLTTAERQIVEIARALAADPAILILDEPTSALDPSDAQRLLRILDGLREAGTGIVFISHRLGEVRQAADRITVMKDGEVVGTFVNETISADELVSRMVGRQLALTFPPRAAQVGVDRLRVSGFSCPGHFREVSFSLAAGEIIGLGGIQGNGQREIMRALFGLLPSQGEIQIDGVPRKLRSPRAALQSGLVYVPADRRGESLFSPLSIRKNVAAPHLSAWSYFGILDRSRETDTVRRIIANFQVRTPSAEQVIALLSGGNQQKVVIGRWTVAKPAVYLFDEPTLGIDVATKAELYRLIRRLAIDGAAVLLLSTDLLELIGLCDRVLVVANGAIVDEVPAAEATEEKIIGSAVRPNGKATNEGNHGAVMRRVGRPIGLATVLWRRYTGPVVLLVILSILISYTVSRSPYFLTQRNLGNLLIQVVPLALVSTGQMAVILLGGIDLSVGPSISLSTALASYLVLNNGAEISGVLLCLLAGLAIGSLNGVLILGCGIPDLISTLATYSVVFGLALVVRPSPGGHVSDRFVDLITLRIGWVPVAGLLVLLIGVVGELLLVKGRIGTKLYATGSNREAAYVAGIAVARVRCLAYMFCGVMAALAGLVVAARIGSGDAQAGNQFTLASIAAVVVGGTSVFGGRGTMVGTLLGAGLLVLMQNALNQLHVTAYYQYIWTGLVLLFAVALYSIREYSRDR